MHPFTADLMAGLHRAELLAEADRRRLVASVPSAPWRPGWPRVAWRETVGARLVEAGLHLLVVVPEPEPCCP